MVYTVLYPDLFFLSCSCASGVIRTTEILDREMVPHYWLSVYATDLGTEPLISWSHVFLEVLDVNDNAPELSQPVYFTSVQENVDTVNSVIKLSATDVDTCSDGKLSFQMLESHRTYFDVDPNTGKFWITPHLLMWCNSSPLTPLYLLWAYCSLLCKQLSGG